jgi:hypothetical protein
LPFGRGNPGIQLLHFRAVCLSRWRLNSRSPLRNAVLFWQSENGESLRASLFHFPRQARSQLHVGAALALDARHRADRLQSRSKVLVFQRMFHNGLCCSVEPVRAIFAIAHIIEQSVGPSDTCGVVGLKQSRGQMIPSVSHEGGMRNLELVRYGPIRCPGQ